MRNATSSLASAFRDNLQPSPFHITNSSQLLSSVRSLLKAYENVDPPKKIQKAVTPKLLRCLFSHYGGPPSTADTPAHAADITIGGFFFAMRSCEYSKTPKPGKTKRVNLGNVVFRDSKKTVISHSSPLLLSSAEYVTITFEDQKNGEKQDSRTQRRTGDNVLCPALRLASAVQRIVNTIPNYNDSTYLCSVYDNENQKVLLINQAYIRKSLRDTCRIFGGKAVFGFDPEDIGNKSI